MSLQKYFPQLELTQDQQKAFQALMEFLGSEHQIFILKGYAGTGKTTLLKGFLKYLKQTGWGVQLMAPTGRAAKILREKTGYEATTIHKGIFSFNDLIELETKDSKTFKYFYSVRNNMDLFRTVLIVDEASMVSNVYSENEFFRFGSGYLLNDLITYSKIHSFNLRRHDKDKLKVELFKNNKILFVGDPAQLPPVNMNFSPALSSAYLQNKYGVSICEVLMKEVIRQQRNSGPLQLATELRKSIETGTFNRFVVKGNGSDIYQIANEDLMDTYKHLEAPKIIITYKNKTVDRLNKQIRIDKYGQDLPIRQGDIIIVGVNNYHHDILNGEFGVVVDADANTITRAVDIGNNKKVSLTWRHVKLLMDREDSNESIVEGYMLENFLFRSDNYIDTEIFKALYIDFSIRHTKLKPDSEEFKDALKKDKFYNAMMLNYGYAITAHKSQGGEWKNIIVLWENQRGKKLYGAMNNLEFYRWSYTAVTRTTDKLFALNPPCFHPFITMTFIDTDIQDSYKEIKGQNLAPETLWPSPEDYKYAERMGLSGESEKFIEHFLLLLLLSRKKNIQIQSWRKNGYELRYSFKRNEEIASLKFWFNKNYEIKNRFQFIPSGTNSQQLKVDLQKIIEKLPGYSIDFLPKENAQTDKKMEVKEELILNDPSLQLLYDKLLPGLKEKNIHIENIEHHNYRERFYFIREGEKAALDFEYNGGGFFGRVLPLERYCNSRYLLRDLKDIINKMNKNDFC